MNTSKEIAKIIETYLKDHKMTLKEFANSVGVTHAAISTWKSKDIVISVYNVAKIADFMNVSIDYLVYGEEYKQVQYVKAYKSGFKDGCEKCKQQISHLINKAVNSLNIPEKLEIHSENPEETLIEELAQAKEQIREKAFEFLSERASGLPKEMDYYAEILTQFVVEKIKENSSVWHKVADGKLPELDKKVWVMTRPDDDNPMVAKRCIDTEYGYTKWVWKCYWGSGFHLKQNQIFAWCEIPPFNSED